MENKLKKGHFHLPFVLLELISYQISNMNFNTNYQIVLLDCTIELVGCLVLGENIGRKEKIK